MEAALGSSLGAHNAGLRASDSAGFGGAWRALCAGSILLVSNNPLALRVAKKGVARSGVRMVSNGVRMFWF